MTNNFEAMAAELEAAEAQASTTTATGEKAPKVKKPRIIKVSFTATEDIAAGTTVEFDYEVPAGWEL